MENLFPRIKKIQVYFILLFAVCLSSCAPNRIITRKVGKEISKSALIKQYQVGIALYDMDKKEMIYQKDADKYFTPASNTKLFTFYAGLKMMPDSLPSLKYVERGDSLIFWGTGDPSFLHTQLKGTKAFDFLKKTDKKLFFSPGRYSGSFYGAGWQWDDYNDYYQAEVNELPLFDNMVLITSTNKTMQILPQTFATCFYVDSLNKNPFNVTRGFLSNKFIFPNTIIPEKYAQQVPYKVSTPTTVNLLSDTLHKYVGIVKMKLPTDAKTIYNVKSDSVFKHMLQPSDNFLAEQLLLTYANAIGTELNTSKIIDYITKNYLSELPDKPRWVDGSGLSRYNLFTPRDMVKLLTLIYQEVNNKQRLFDMLPAGGKVGTLKNAYPKTDSPFVFAKTGSVSNNHNQSGYVVTKTGRVLVFSFMNNNFINPTAEVRKEMVRVMTFIHDNF